MSLRQRHQHSQEPFKDRDFCSRIFMHIRAQGLIPRGSRCLLAVSGGLDSMVMLDFFVRFARQKYQAEFVVAHLDHGLREDSATACGWLAEYCAARGLAFASQHIDVQARLAESTQSSLEAVAREARYQWLEAIAEEQDCGLIVTAHSASDQLETILMRLIRGGIAGLGGMAPDRALGQVRLVRPLLAVGRGQIAAYARHHGLEWYEDPSNQDPAFFRNRVRAELVPWLLQQNPELESSLAIQAGIWREEQAWLQAEAVQRFAALATAVEGGFDLPVKLLLAEPVPMQRRLIKCALTRHLGSWKLYGQLHIEAIRLLAAGPGAKALDLPGELLVSKQKGRLSFRRKAADDGLTAPDNTRN